MSVKIFSGAGCPNCTSLKGWLERKGKVEGVDFEVVDVYGEEGSQLAQKHNVKGLPTTIKFEGDEIVSTVLGFSPADSHKIEALYAEVGDFE